MAAEVYQWKNSLRSLASLDSLLHLDSSLVELFTFAQDGKQRSTETQRYNGTKGQS